MTSKKLESTWYEIVLPTRNSLTEIAATLLAEQGYGSCEIRTVDDNREAIVVYHRDTNYDAAYERARELAASIASYINEDPQVNVVPEQTWTESWKQHFPRLRIGERIEVIPPWESIEDVESSRIAVVIHPAMAFGTGHHETTHGCVEILDAIVRAGDHVADIGCGTAVLAITAVKLGAARAVAIDNDKEAVDAARENCLLNDAADAVDVRLGDGPPLGAQFDVVVANIYAETLAGMQSSLTSCVKPGGHLVLSGIEASRFSLIEDAFRDDVWETVRTIENGNWVTVCLRRTKRIENHE